jgi:hypothetical protein
LFRFVWVVIALSAVFLAHTGCTGSQSQSAEREQSNLKPLAVLYGQFIARHGGQPPASEEEFKAFIDSLDESELPAEIEDREQLFVSSRDGKPYVVLYGKAATSGPPGPAGSPVVAYEQEGQGGTRFVASSMGAVEEVDEPRFAEWVPSAQ